MVNKTVFEYFRKNRGKYPIEALKKKALSAGYTQEDVEDAAVMSMKIEDHAPKKQEKTKETSPATSTTKTKETKKEDTLQKAEQKVIALGTTKRPFGWMKLAGILGLFFFILYLSMITAGVYFEADLATFFSPWVVTLIAIISGIYLYGFVRVGTHTKSKLLTIASYARIGLAILFIGLYILLRPVLLNTNIGPGAILIGLSFAYAILFLTAKYTFATGLTKLGTTLRFFKVVGILTYIYTTLITIGFLYTAYLFFSAGTINLDPTTLNLLYWDFVIIEIFNISALFFEAIALFYAHKKFE